MDFHSLPRRDLQALCKKNKIPANLTNVAMADALKSLKSIEWDEEIKQKLMPQSESVEQPHGSPLPRSRRVTAISNDTSDFTMEEMPDKEGEMKKETLIEANQTPLTAARRSQRIQSSMSTRTRARTSATATGTATRTGTAATGSVIRTSAAPAGRLTSASGTRTRKVQKDEAPAEVMAAATPAPQRGRKKALETPAQIVPTPATRRGQKKATETPAPVAIARLSVRPTRQSTRKLTESTKGSKVTTTMANMMSLDVVDDKEIQAVVEKVEEKGEQTAVELQDILEISKTIPELNLDTEEKENIVSDAAPEKEQEPMTDVIELGEATQPDAANMVEAEEQTYQNEADEVSEESEPAKEDIQLAKEDELVSEEILNLMDEVSEESEPAKEEIVLAKENELVSEEILNLIEHDTEQIECTEENIVVGFDINAVVSTEKSENSVEENSTTSNVSFVVDSEIPAEEVEEAEEKLNSEDKDDASVEQPVEEVNVVESGPAVAPISDEVQVAPVMEESDVNEATPADSPIMGLVSEVGLENNSDIQDASLSDITVDAQVAPSDLCFSSPVRAPGDIGMEKMLDSVVRRFAKASIKDSAKKTDAFCVVQKEEAIKIVSNDAPGIAQNENAVKEKVDLNGMSLRKLRALYKDSLIKVNSKLAEEGKDFPLAEERKRLPLGDLDENIRPIA